MTICTSGTLSGIYVFVHRIDDLGHVARAAQADRRCGDGRGEDYQPAGQHGQPDPAEAGHHIGGLSGAARDSADKLGKAGRAKGHDEGRQQEGVAEAARQELLARGELRSQIGKDAFFPDKETALRVLLQRYGDTVDQEQDRTTDGAHA